MIFDLEGYGQLNHWLQAMPGFALLIALALCPGMPEPKRYA
jgi:hypothetical protein